MGLPLASNSGKYNVYEIKYIGDDPHVGDDPYVVYKSTVAPTTQTNGVSGKTYYTDGGGEQILIFDNQIENNWEKSLIPSGTIEPEVLPILSSKNN
jgi:hypothetical protein